MIFTKKFDRDINKEKCKENGQRVVCFKVTPPTTHLFKREIDWHFNPSAASHMGGVRKRQIRTIRKVLMIVIPQQTLDNEALMTLLTVVEGIVNNRPITQLSDHPRDSTPLTPNHLLMLRQGPSLPHG